MNTITSKLDDDAIDRLAGRLRELVAARGIRGLLLIDGEGRPVLVPWGEPVEVDPCAAEEPIVQARTYALTITRGPCQTTGRRAGQRRRCELVGGDHLCQWVPY